MTVDINDPRPPYVQVADGLRAAIRSGDLAPGVRLPSGRELASEWGVALMTLQKAVDLLRDEGLVYSQQGRGVFVAAAGTERPADELIALRETVENLERRLAVVEERLQTNDNHRG
ncbi:regulatory GntR family protein [Kribbella steppae]|uniref:Regulatory GntR family protein n=1 Tax=Kribbella steppae TaxID=2512223 RepID=A0A4R2HPC7_9ACTN|nr:GntR family transcriptional regulator [Kribbella steppae]TCO33012.1 regulatory GntR family protein [Kribbella steppae]